MRIALPGLYPFHVCASAAHWKPNGTNHGPKSMPRVIAAALVKLGATSPPWIGRRIWVYFRGGYAWHAEVYIDRREV